MSSFLELTRATNEPRYTFYSLVLLSPFYPDSQAWHSVRHKGEAGEACGGDRIHLAPGSWKTVDALYSHMKV